MTKTLRRLTEDYAQNSYAAYPLGFYKRVSLGEEKKEKMGDILAELTGNNWDMTILMKKALFTRRHKKPDSRWK